MKVRISSLSLFLLTALLAGAFLTATPAYAATITVGGACTLPDAVTAANTDTATGGCSAGSGADVIEISGGTITLSGTALSINSEVTINGGGATVDANNASQVFDISGGPVIINDMTITGGTNAGNGGGIVQSAGDLTLNNVTVSGNTTTSGNGDGGGIYWLAGMLTINNSTISGNTSSDDGGGLAVAGGTVDITNSTISNNNAGPAGDSPQGGGMRVSGATATVNMTYVTVFNNTANDNGGTGGTGGGIQFNSGTANVDRSIIIGNNSTNSGNEDCSANLSSVTSSAVEVADNCVAAAGSNLDTTAALLQIQALADNGGGTQTNALTAGSSGEDFIAADGSCGAGAGATDQRGAQRAGGAAANGNTGCEPGAFEISSQTPTAVTMTDSGVTSSSSYLLPFVIAALALSFATLAMLRKPTAVRIRK